MVDSLHLFACDVHYLGALLSWSHLLEGNHSLWLCTGFDSIYGVVMKREGWQEVGWYSYLLLIKDGASLQLVSVCLLHNFIHMV